jgi:hypothetical protein
VTEDDGTIGCGALPNTAPDAPAEVAQQDMLNHLRRHWDFTGELTWQKPNRTGGPPSPPRTHNHDRVAGVVTDHLNSIRNASSEAGH